MSEAVKALLNYRQADEEGIMVLTSRQAIHEVAARIEQLEAALREHACRCEQRCVDVWEDVREHVEPTKADCRFHRARAALWREGMTDIVERPHAMIDANYGDVAADSVYGSAMSDAADEIARLRGDLEAADIALSRLNSGAELQTLMAENNRLRAALHWVSLQHYTDQRTVTPEIAHQAYRPLIAHVNAICAKAHAALGEKA